MNRPVACKDAFQHLRPHSRLHVQRAAAYRVIPEQREHVTRFFILILVGLQDIRPVPLHRIDQRALLLIPFGNIHARQRRQPPLRVLRGNVNPVPIRDEPPQFLQHPRAFLALRRSAENGYELLLIVPVRAAFQQALEKLVLHPLRHLALQQLEATSRHAELVLEAFDHFGEKSVHRP